MNSGYQIVHDLNTHGWLVHARKRRQRPVRPEQYRYIPIKMESAILLCHHPILSPVKKSKYFPAKFMHKQMLVHIIQSCPPKLIPVFSNKIEKRIASLKGIFFVKLYIFGKQGMQSRKETCCSQPAPGHKLAIYSRVRNKASRNLL